MWTLEIAKTGLDSFLGPEMIPTTDSKLKLFKKDDNEEFRIVQNLTLAEIFQPVYARGGVSWSLKQKTLLERKTGPNCLFSQCQKTWMNQLSWLIC